MYSCLPVYRRASFMAPSMASAPPLPKKVLVRPCGRDLRNLFGEIGYRLHVVNIGRTVDQLVHLSFGGIDDFGITVSGVHH